jgi:hypothetical protein
MDRLKAWAVSKSTFEKVFRIGTILMIVALVLSIASSAKDSASNRPTVLQALVILDISLVMIVYALTYMIASWSLNEDEFYELITTTSIMGDAWYNKFSKSYWLWNHRTLSIPGLLIGLLGLFFGFVNLWQYVF